MVKRIIVCCFLVFLSQSVYAQCIALYPNLDKIYIRGTTELCNSFYVTLYDVKNNAVVLTSERLRKTARVGSTTRLNSFRADPRIGISVTNSVYKLSGYDRGHMAAADNASTLQEAKDTFLLSNMTPQNPVLNRTEWRKLEEYTRMIWKTSKTDVFILTIAIYNKPMYLKGIIPVPKGYWKILYYNGTVRYFYAENTSISQVREYTNIDIRKITTPIW